MVRYRRSQWSRRQESCDCSPENTPHPTILVGRGKKPKVACRRELGPNLLLRLLFRSPARARYGPLSSGLLFRHIADDRQLEHLALIGLEDHNQPENEAGEANQRPQEHSRPSQERDVPNKGQHDP